MFAAVEKKLQAVTRVVAVIGGGGLLFAIAVTCLSIAGRLIRRALEAVLPDDLAPRIGPILGEEEIVQYAVGFALFTALPRLTLQRGHITVDLLKDFFHPFFARLLDFFAQLFLTVIVYLMMTQQWFLIFRKARGGQESFMRLLAGGDWAALRERLRDGDESQILGLKLWPLYTVAELCVILLFVVCVFCLLRAARDLRRAAA